MRTTPQLCAAMRLLKQRARRAEASRFRAEQAKTVTYRCVAAFDAHLLICAAQDVVRAWETAKMPTLDELLQRERHHTAATAAEG